MKRLACSVVALLALLLPAVASADATQDVKDLRAGKLPLRYDWRAYQKNDMPAALASFTEATSIDPSFALGWYNRASLESRNADLPKAKASFESATKLDGTLAKRACKDPDFKALRAAEPSLFGC